jgi:cobalt transporter subunit CbtB
MNNIEVHSVVDSVVDNVVDGEVGSIDRILSNKNTQLLFALLFGLVVITTIALAPMDVVHSAAHDVRHVHAFPCH